MSDDTTESTSTDAGETAEATPDTPEVVNANGIPPVADVGSDDADDLPGDVVATKDDADDEAAPSSITEPGKVMRIGSMVKQLLEEVRAADLDEASRERLAEVYERSIVELSDALSPDLQEELRMLSLPFDEEGVPSEAEIRVAKAQLVGWLEGLFHGIQASLMAQQVAAQQQLQEMKQIPAGQGGPGGQPGGRRPTAPPQTGTYL